MTKLASSSHPISNLEAKGLAIDVKNLTKKFNKKVAVDHLNLQVRKGEIFGFLGPNGSGKTTTIRMLCGLLTPDSGEGHVLGYNILTQSDEIKRRVGYMTQQFSLYTDLTVTENLKFIAQIYQIKNYQERVATEMKNMQLIPFQDQLVGNLSGGWKQRCALAAALLHNPELLLLDEPTAGVDPKARRDFWDRVYYLAEQGITILVTTHYMDEAQRCHRLGYISQGKLLAVGTMDELIHHTALITWLVVGTHLQPLAAELRKKPGIEQVISFGNTLHVSGKNAAALASAIAPFQQNPQYQWTEIPSSIEDVFIYLVAGEQSSHDN